MRDPRASSTIQAYLRIVGKIRPNVLLFENVAGFAFRERDEGYASLVRGLRRINRQHGTRYEPQLIKINAADFGVPQLRERIFVVAHHRGRTLAMPTATHGPDSPSKQPYTTAWDAIADLNQELPELVAQGRWADLLPSIPEGKNYLWHTPGKGGLPLFGWRTKYWSFLLKLAKNLPAWTISASPGPAAGPFHWRNRMLSSRELCRLQTFPDHYSIVGNRREAHRQIGNAVPPTIGELIGLQIRRQLLRHKSAPTQLKLVTRHRLDCPNPEPLSAVPHSFTLLTGDHKPHPGTGKGPAPQQELPSASSKKPSRKRAARPAKKK
jgi:DNA (cytosine-5)-methyltransferase 1